MFDLLLISAENRHKMIHTLCRALEKFDCVSLKFQAQFWRNEADKYVHQIQTNIQLNRMIQTELQELKNIQESAHYLYVHALRNKTYIT